MPMKPVRPERNAPIKNPKACSGPRRSHAKTKITTPTPGSSRSGTWVALSRAVRGAGLPDGEVHAFIHGNADMIKELRAWLFVEHQVPRQNVSISGYWRTGQDEDAWQATKQDFVASMEAEQGA